MGSPFTIQIFYPDGDPENMRIADKKNWTGKIFYISRDYWKTGADQYRGQLETPGVYVLAGTDENSEDNDNLQSIYIGQAENLFTRIEQHVLDTERSFWGNVVCVTGRGDFNNAHFRWMESHLVKRAKENDRCDLKNLAMPSKPQIAESDVVDVKQFIKETLQIFPVVEIGAFTAPKAVPAHDPGGEQKKGAGFGKEERSEILNKALAAFQKRKNVKLLKRSQATFYDKSKTFHVCCGVSKNYPNKKQNSYWFTPGKRWFDFLASGDKGYLLFCMEGQHQAVALSFDEFDKMKGDFGTTTGKSENLWWHVIIYEENGNFKFKPKGGGALDVSPHLFDID